MKTVLSIINWMFNNAMVFAMGDCFHCAGETKLQCITHYMEMKLSVLHFQLDLLHIKWSELKWNVKKCLK